MGQPNSTPEKSSENVEERKQDYALKRLNDRTESRCLSEMIGYLRDSSFLRSLLRQRFYRNYKEFLYTNSRDAEKFSSIPALHTDPKRFIQNNPLIIKELEAILAKKENKITSLQEETLKLQSKSKSQGIEFLFTEEGLQYHKKRVELAKLTEEEKKLNILIQELIKLLEDTPEKCESGRQRTENDELREKLKEEKNQEIKKLNDHVEELKEEILNLQKEKKILQEKMDNEKDNVERENQKLEGMVQKIKQEIKRLNDQGKELNDRNQSLQKAMKKLQEKKKQENKRLNDHVEELEDVNQDLQNEMKIQKEKQHLEIQKLVSEKDHLKRENRKLENMVQELGIDKSRETETAEAMEMQKRNEPSTIAQQVTEDDDGRVVPSCVSLRN